MRNRTEPVRQDHIVRLPEKVAWQASVDARIKLYRAVKILGAHRVRLDFSAVASPHANGMVPIVALVNDLIGTGVSFDIILPSIPNVRILFARRGWLRFLTDGKATPPSDARDFPLRKFEDDRTLNAAVTEAVEVCLQELNFAEGVPQAFEWALNEIAGNVLEHSKASCGWLQATPYASNLGLVVCDTGVGIRHALKRRFKTDDDIQALELAMTKGVSSVEDAGRGNGLAGAVAIARKNNGLFVIVSGKGRIKVMETGEVLKNEGPAYLGTLAEMQFMTRKPLCLPAVLWGHTPVSHIESAFEDGASLVVTLKNYASTFGNRRTGRRIRRLIKNLLVQDRDRYIVVSLRGIKVLSSSFADEVFGKLFEKLGPERYSKRMRYEGCNEVCKAAIASAISDHQPPGA